MSSSDGPARLEQLTYYLTARIHGIVKTGPEHYTRDDGHKFKLFFFMHLIYEVPADALCHQISAILSVYLVISCPVLSAYFVYLRQVLLGGEGLK